MVRESIFTLALLHKFVYEFGGNNAYIIQNRTALFRTLELSISMEIYTLRQCSRSTLNILVIFYCYVFVLKTILVKKLNIFRVILSVFWVTDL